MTHFGPRRLDSSAMHKVIFHLPRPSNFAFDPYDGWSRCFEAVLESGVVFGFGLWTGHVGVTIGIQNTRQHRCIDDGADD
jgi:hypothetical protein